VDNLDEAKRLWNEEVDWKALAQEAGMAIEYLRGCDPNPTWGGETPRVGSMRDGLLHVYTCLAKLKAAGLDI
jgi:hypothetical protein